MGRARLEQQLIKKSETNEKIFSPFIMAGDGGLDNLPKQIAFLATCGAATIEIGIPFSDPVADGPTIQAAGLRALENGTTLEKVFDILETTKEERAIPVVVMSYLNPILAYGVEEFAHKCDTAGVDGVIIPDLPMEEEAFIAKALTKQAIAFIRLAAMTSPKERLITLAKRSEGFLYAVAVNGTTGERATHKTSVLSYLAELKTYSDVPVLAGFGVATKEQARSLSEHCDGVIVGSKIVQLLHEKKYDAIQSFITGSLAAYSS